MDIRKPSKTIKIFIGESDRVSGKLLYEKIIEHAREAGLAGATVYRGIMSFGASHSIHTMKIFALSGDLPIVIEVVDNVDAIDKFIPELNDLMDESGKGGLVYVENVDVIRYETGKKYRKNK
ncbi:MAG: DUF190 domain-containing protein [Prolixibacteraceae bacterium]|jgi:PII-like signaling protein|nr:DUF190 domain-containing protein [Prolixibacteraceae bacterium]